MRVSMAHDVRGGEDTGYASSESESDTALPVPVVNLSKANRRKSMKRLQGRLFSGLDGENYDDDDDDDDADSDEKARRKRREQSKSDKPESPRFKIPHLSKRKAERERELQARRERGEPISDESANAKSSDDGDTSDDPDRNARVAAVVRARTPSPQLPSTLSPRAAALSSSPPVANTAMPLFFGGDDESSTSGY